MLDQQDLQSGRSSQPFYTIGYSGRTIEEFTGALRRRNVSAVVDVRRTPLSRFKPDFSKRRLAAVLATQNIDYIHLPELGVPKEIRARLAQTGDYAAFFDWYDGNVVPIMTNGLMERISGLMSRSVAFMCTERDGSKCHRYRVSVALEKMGYQGFEIGSSG